MTKFVGSVAVILVLPSLLLAGEQGVDGEAAARFDVGAFERLTGHWIGLRSELAREQQEWQRQQQHWQREIALLEREIITRGEVIAADTQQLSGFEQVHTDALAQKEQIDVTLRDLEVVLGRHELRLREWEGWIPAGLRADIGSGFRALPGNAAAASRMGVLRRLQTVLALYTQIETLQNNLHVVREMLEVGEARREVDVLYLGLARGLAVSASDDWAATGRPVESGWVWEPDPGQAANIRLALRVLQRDAVVQIVPLPLQVDAEVLP